jgi:probable DNA metabolism protein
MKGFVRFRLVREGFYYARLEPDHNVLPLIAPHFADRFSDQDWIIHDLRRGMAIVHDVARKQRVTADLDLLENPDFSDGEKLYQDLWKKYFTRIAVEERFNPGLQRQNLPFKYRRNLVEIEE